jgi:hypothetical protein
MNFALPLLKNLRLPLTGVVNAGKSHNTTDFNVERLRQWWSLFLNVIPRSFAAAGKKGMRIQIGLGSS